MRIAVDAMGGDSAPEEIIKGALLALEKDPSLQVILVGDTDLIQPCLEKHLKNLPQACRDKVMENLSFNHAPEVVGMEESPVKALRKKKNSSILKCANLLKKSEADALVTAGNTGAAVTAAHLRLKLIPGIRRTGIAVTIPVLNGICTIIDAGANLHCKPRDLFNYGIMASNLCRKLLQKEKPAIGLLNIGVELAKGNDLVKKTDELFRQSSLNYKGFIEGQEIFKGIFDVVVCEGFVGNAVLKVSEGVAEYFMRFFDGEFEESLETDMDRSLWNKIRRKYAQKVNYSEYGGALLLGIDGICVICHGRSDSKAIASAIKLAKSFAEIEVNKHIESKLEQASHS